MKFNSIIILLLALGICSCKEQSKSYINRELKIIPVEKIVSRAKSGELNFDKAKYLRWDGLALMDSDREHLNQGKLAKDYYEDAFGNIKEVRVRKANLGDRLIEIQRIEIAQNPLREIKRLDVNCDDLQRIYADMERFDKEARTEGANRRELDMNNQQMLVSIIEKCGITEADLDIIWMIIQHGPDGIMAYYFSDLEAYVTERKLSINKIALLKDRMLMRHGYKQVFGTQIINGYLYDLDDPKNVNTRRSQNGLAPLEKYLSHYGLDYETEIARMKTQDD